MSSVKLPAEKTVEKTVKKAAKHLSLIATLLEVVGAESRRVNSYRFASRSLEDFQGSLDDAIVAATDKKIRGFGDAILSALLEFYERGTSTPYEELVQELGLPFLEILSIRGIGGKKAKLLREEADITSLESLETACSDGTLLSMKGFGKKSIESILKEIETYKANRGALRIDQALALESNLLDIAKEQQLVLAAVDSFRRRSEMLHSVVLLSQNSPSELSEAFAKQPEWTVHEVTEDAIELDSAGGTAVSIRSEASEFIYKAFRESCSDFHFSELDTIASSHSVDLKELARSFDTRTTTDDTTTNAPINALDAFEQALYATLSLPFVPAELREELPLSKLSQLLSDDSLLSLEHISGIVHAHSHYSDGTSSLSELASFVKEQGFHYLGISDHSQTAAYARGLSVDDIRRQHDEIDSLNERLAPFVILKGIESDILRDGSLDYPDAVLESFDFVIASLHSSLTMNREEMTQRLKRAIENPYTTCIGHITTRKLLQREEAEMELYELIEYAAEYSVALEINANPIRLDLPYRYHQFAIEQGVMLPVCPDAHSLEGVSDIAFGVLAARKGGVPRSSVPTAWEAEKAISFWNKK